MLSTVISLLPIFLFLFALIALDSYKLVKSRLILATLFVGCCGAMLSLVLTTFLVDTVGIDVHIYVRYLAPCIEESCKGIYIFYLIRTKRVGFLVDAAIQGFAIGAGFAFIENIYYLRELQDVNIAVWIVRGFGTAIMHGGTTAIFGILLKNFSDQHSANRWKGFLPGLGVAVVIHSLYNHFLLPPMFSTLLLLIVLPTILYAVFKKSAESTREWLGVSLDADMELLHLITTGNFSESKIGKYLSSLADRFPGESIADMLGLLRLHTELSMKAKGLLMMRELGYSPENDPEIQEKFTEIKYLEKSIGRTGMAAISPFLHTSSQGLWQVYMLKQ